jgi:hypothetical protein
MHATTLTPLTSFSIFFEVSNEHCHSMFSKTPHRNTNAGGVSSRTPGSALLGRTAPSADPSSFPTSSAKRRKVVLSASDQYNLSTSSRLPAEVEALVGSSGHSYRNMSASLGSSSSGSFAWLVSER